MPPLCAISSLFALPCFHCRAAPLLQDAKGRKRLTALGPYPNSVTSLAFNHDGALLAIASSYDFTSGDKPEHAPDAIYIRSVGDAEVKPKSMIAAPK